MKAKKVSRSERKEPGAPRAKVPGSNVLGMLIYETNNYTVEAPLQPLVTRKDGGHITITPKVRLSDRT